MNNEFEPINSNLLGEDMSNFSLRNIFRRKRKNKTVTVETKKVTETTKKNDPAPISNKPVDRILKAIDNLRSQFNYNGDVSNQSLNNSYSYLGEISDVNNAVNEGYKNLVNDFVKKYKPLIPPTSSGSTSTVTQKINLINQLKYDLKNYTSVGDNESYPPMVIDENFDYMKNSPTYDVTSKEDIQLYGIKNPSKKSLRSGQRAMIKLVNGKTKDNGIFLVVLEKGGNKDELQGQYVPAYYHPFKMDNEKSGGKLNTIEDVLKNIFTLNVNKSQDQITE